MQKKLFIKIGIIVTLSFILAIGLVIIQSLVGERQSYAEQVIREISEQHVNPQEIITPFIILPTTIVPACLAATPDDCARNYLINQPIFPSSTEATQQLAVSTDDYKRSIYSATSYKGNIEFNQQYNLGNSSSNSNQTSSNTSNANAGNTNASASASTESTQASTSTEQPTQSYQQDYSKNEDWQSARLVIPVSDLRGVIQLPTVTINGSTHQSQYPTTSELAGLSYIEVPLPQSFDASSPLDIQVNLELSGLSKLRTIPLGDFFSSNMTSNWQTPNFIGQALPNNKSFDNKGFNASWQNQYLTVANNQQLNTCLNNGSGFCVINNDLSAVANNDNLQAGVQNEIYATRQSDGNISSDASTQHLKLNGFGVSFAQPTDVYLQTERTLAYGLLLILVSFGTFFLFEVIKSFRIHPIQYLLVGSALLVFYVLLLPLAEQIPFWQAYTIAATACVGLIGWYAFYVLNSGKRAILFTLILGSLYASFYGILSTEDLNLLLGAIFCFVLLAAVMYLTRKIDWYQVA